MARVVGIDPGVAATGYAVVDLEELSWLLLREAGVWRTPPGPLERRLELLYARLLGLLRRHRPACVVVEDLYAHYRHPRTAILMGHARGVVYLAAARAGAPVHSLPASRVKKALTGRGDASKRQVLRMAEAMAGPGADLRSHHAADALALALCYALERGREAAARLQEAGGRP